MLACGACGAPLNLQKQRKVEPSAGEDRPAPVGVAVPGKKRKPVKPQKAKYTSFASEGSKPKKVKVEKHRKTGGYRKPKKRKGMWSRLFDEAVDAIEDIFD